MKKNENLRMITGEGTVWGDNCEYSFRHIKLDLSMNHSIRTEDRKIASQHFDTGCFLSMNIHFQSLGMVNSSLSFVCVCVCLMFY